MLAAARGRWPHAGFELAGADCLPFGDGVPRVIGWTRSFHEVADPGAALGEARRVLTSIQYGGM
jgi:ubiquinone/menaquinone biosynthesis C-methylase UbiE